QEAGVERLSGDELFEALPGGDVARVGEVEGGDGVGDGVLAALAQREVVPVVRRGPLVTGADRDRLDAGGLEGVDGLVQLVHRRGCLGDAGLVEQVGVVPAAHQTHGEGQRVGAAVDLPALDVAAQGGDGVGGDVGQVLDQSCLDVVGELA